MSGQVHVTPIGSGMEQAVQTLADSDPFLSQAFQPGDRVILKPNFVAPRKSSTGTTTSLELLRALARLIRDLGAEAWLCESPGMEYSWEEVFKYLGIEQLARETGLRVVDVPRAEFADIRCESNRFMKSARVPAAVLGAKILNVPKLKTHVTTKVTLGMKNLMGLCHNTTKRWMHVRGIEPCIADLNRILRPAYTVVDAGTVMEGDGGVYGNSREMNLLVGGCDVAQVDRACCRMMGIDPQTVPHIAALNVENESIRTVMPRGDFRVPRHHPIYHALYRGMYAVDYAFRPMVGEHFNAWLYRTGHFGTRPRIQEDLCDRCGKCASVCPSQCIDLQSLTIQPQACIRCLDCYEICPIDAIKVRGFSNPHHDVVLAK